MTVDLNPMHTRHANGQLPKLVAAARGVIPPATGVSSPRPPAPEPAPVDPDSVDQLLHRAEQLDQSRVRRAADRIRAEATTLRDLLSTAEIEARLQAELQQHLDRAAELRAQLRRLNGGQNPASIAAGAPEQRAANTAIRAWAAEHGVDCPPIGRIPGHVHRAYLEAHP